MLSIIKVHLLTCLVDLTIYFYSLYLKDSRFVIALNWLTSKNCMANEEKVSLIASDNQSTGLSSPYRSHTIPLTIFFLALYSISDLSLPLYNKVLDNGFGSEKGFHYPVTSATFQVGLVSLCLMIWCVIERAWKRRNGKSLAEEWVFSSFKGFLLKM